MTVSRTRSRLWAPEDLAEYLNVPVGWIYKRTRKNGPDIIPHCKLGKYLRFDPESVSFQDWLARHQVAIKWRDDLTLAVTGNRVRPTEKTGQVG